MPKFPIIGILNYLKETFTHTPSYDMSPAMLSVLVKMMLAQAQESVFEKICLSGIQNEFFMLVKVAQEVAKVSLPGFCDFWRGVGCFSVGPLEAGGASQDSLPTIWAACPPCPDAGLHFLGKYQCFRYGSLIPFAA